MTKKKKNGGVKIISKRKQKIIKLLFEGDELEAEVARACDRTRKPDPHEMIRPCFDDHSD